MSVVQRAPRYARPWLYLALVAVGWLAITAIGLLAHHGQVNQSAVLFPPDSGADTVTYHGQAYLTNTERLGLPDDQMLAIGQTREGYTVYARRADVGYGGGGGGGAIVPPKGSVTPGPAYLKAVDGRFVPLVPR
jgi:hypothetical protein